MSTIMHPRVVLLKKVLMQGIDSADAVVGEIKADGQIKRATMLSIHLGIAESTAQWLCDLATHYKNILDEVAVALSSAPQAMQACPQIGAAMQALDKVQDGYMDGAGSTDMPFHPGI